MSTKRKDSDKEHSPDNLDFILSIILPVLLVIGFIVVVYVWNDMMKGNETITNTANALAIELLNKL